MENQILFREMLGELKTLAQSRGGRLSRQETEAFFEKASLDSSQIDLICEYLLTQGIILDGYKRSREAAEQMAPPKPEDPEGSAWETEDPQTGAERADAAEAEEPGEEMPGVLELYMRELEDFAGHAEREAQEELKLFEAMVDGDRQARDELVRIYLPVIAQMAGEYEEENIETEDLLQEGNIALLTTLSGMQRQESLAAYRTLLLNGINDSMGGAISSSGEEKNIETATAAKINLLQDAIRELSEDSEQPVTIGELSVYLDMPAETIRDLMRLAGNSFQVS